MRTVPALLNVAGVAKPVTWAESGRTKVLPARLFQPHRQA